MLIRLRTLADHRIIGTTDTRFTRRWQWTQETVSEHSGCDPDDVHEVETDDGDIITADGKPYAITERKYGWEILGCGEWA